jgi:TPR repeat protein
MAYTIGMGAAKNPAEAVKWSSKAAQQGIPQGQESLRALAQEGYAPAQNALGMTYEKGWGSLKIDAEAVNWYRRAAEQKLAAAQLNLGRMYAAGKGTRQSDVEAYKWFALAAAQGNPDARKQLAEVAKKLTAEQIAEAKQIAH